MAAGIRRRHTPPLPTLQHALGNQCLGRRRLEIRALPQVLPSGTDYLERAILQPVVVDYLEAPVGRNTVPLRGVPVQFCQFQEVQGKVFLEASGTPANVYGR